MHAVHHFEDIRDIDPFAFDPAEFFDGLRSVTEIARDRFAENRMVAADPLRGSGRAYVLDAGARLLDFLREGGWAPLPAHEAVGLPTGLWFIEDPVELPPDATLMLAHWTAKSYADDLNLFFGRRDGERTPDGVFVTRSVVRQPASWVTSADDRAIVDQIVSAQYAWIGGRSPLIVANILRHWVGHEVARLNSARAVAGAKPVAVPSITTIRDRMRTLNERHGWPGGRVRNFVDPGQGFNLI